MSEPGPAMTTATAPSVNPVASAPALEDVDVLIVGAGMRAWARPTICNGNALASAM